MEWLQFSFFLLKVSRGNICKSVSSWTRLFIKNTTKDAINKKFCGFKTSKINNALNFFILFEGKILANGI